MCWLRLSGQPKNRLDIKSSSHLQINFMTFDKQVENNRNFMCKYLHPTKLKYHISRDTHSLSHGHCVEMLCYLFIKDGRGSGRTAKAILHFKVLQLSRTTYFLCSPRNLYFQVSPPCIRILSQGIQFIQN